MRDLTHEEAAELLAEAALDTLVANEQAAVLAHAAACPECGAALAALRDATTELAFSLATPSDDPARRARIRTRLLARARADLAVAQVDARGGASHTSRPTVAPQAPDARSESASPRRPAVGHRLGGHRRAPRTPSTVIGWGVAAITGIAAVVVIAVAHARTADLDRRTAVVRTADSLRIAQLSDSVAGRDSTLRELTGSQLSVIHLAAVTPRGAWGWMFWNHATNHWTFLAHNLPAVATGKTYQLWLVTPRAKVSAGTFAPTLDGSAELRATYALARDSLRAVAVTEESAGGVPQPTGPFIITANAGL